MGFWDWIKNWILASFGISLIKEGNPQGYINCVFMTITVVFGIFLFYRTIYMIVGLFGHSRRFPLAKPDKRYCFVFCARNEEKVIGNLIDSTRDLSYDQSLLDIIVLADNCSPDDKTAEIARKKGCIVYERHDLSKCRKGYALQWLFSQLKHDLPHGIETYYAYLFMDSDNVMAKDFLNRLNDAFQAGYDVVTGYRNVKNPSENWLTAIGAFNLYRGPLASARARSVFCCNHQITGTGFGIRSFLIRDGWPCTMLLEDNEMTTRLMAKEPRLRLTLSPSDFAAFFPDGHATSLTLVKENGVVLCHLKPSLGENSELEIPETWAKKRHLSFVTNELGDLVLKDPVTIGGRSFPTRVTHYVRITYVEAAQYFDEQPSSFRIAIRQRLRWAKGGMAVWLFPGQRLLLSFFRRPRWSKYDFFWEIFPYGLVTFLMGFLQLLLTTIFWATGASGTAVDGWENLWSYLLNITVFQYVGNFFIGILIVVKEWKRMNFSVTQTIRYLFLWPLFDMAGVPISILCLCMHVGWKPIPHHVVANGNVLLQSQHQNQMSNETKHDENPS